MKTALSRLSLVCCLGAIAAGCSKAGPPAAPPTLAPSAAASAGVAPPLTLAELEAKRLIIVDGHVDLPFRLEMGLADGHVTEDVSTRTPKGDFDLVRAKQGGLDAPFMSIYVPASYQESGGARAFADHLIDLVEGLASAHPNELAIAATPGDVRTNSARGMISLPLGIENGAALEGKLENIAHFRERAVSYITLTHGKDNDICDTSYESQHTHHGLSPFGKLVIAEMNRVGIMVDIAHVSDEAFFQAIEQSQVPVIASHSSLRHFVPSFERDVSDEMLDRLAARGGVIMINFGSAFLTPEANAVSEKRKLAAVAYAAEQHLDHNVIADAVRIEEYVAAQLPMPLARVEDVADHIDRVKQRVGIDHVGLGSDFEGVGNTLPIGLEDVSHYPNLLRVLLERGYTEQELEKLCSGNVLRVWQATLDFAAASASKAPRPNG